MRRRADWAKVRVFCTIWRSILATGGTDRLAFQPVGGDQRRFGAGGFSAFSSSGGFVTGFDLRISDCPGISDFQFPISDSCSCRFSDEGLVFGVGLLWAGGLTSALLARFGLEAGVWGGDSGWSGLA